MSDGQLGAPLSPQEAKTIMDGERMLNAIQQQQEKEQGGPILLGPDGKAIEKQEPKEKTPEEQAIEAEKAKLKAHKQARERIEANSAKLQEICREYPDARTCANMIYHFWTGLFWALNQIQTYPNMTNEMVQQLSDSTRLAAMEAGMPIPELASVIKNKGLPFMLQVSRVYEAEKTQRRNKLVKALNMLPEGITVPVQEIRELFPKFMYNDKAKQIFFLEHVYVLQGSAKAVGRAVRLCARLHKEKDEGLPYFLSCNPIVSPEDQEKCGVVMPLAWWQDKAADPEKLAETLAPMVKSQSMLLVIEDIGPLLQSGDERKLHALSRVFTWAYEHQRAVVVGDEVPEGDQPSYGKLPHLAVTIDSSDNLVFGKTVYKES